MISFKQLTYALAVEKTRHFKKAAEMCSVSQSALSTAIAELEKQLSVQIFERDNKKVMVTPLGKVFLDKARHIKLSVDDLYDLARSHKTPLSYPLSLGVIPTIGPYLLPAVLPALRDAYPNLKLSIVEEQSHVLADMVRDGELDTAILALPYPTEGLHAFEFWQEDFYLLVHKDSEYAEHSSLSGDDIQQSELLLLKDGHCLRDHAMAACKLRSGETGQSLSGTSLSTLVHMVAGKMGTTLVPEMALDSLMPLSNELRAIHLSEPGPHRRLAFVSRLNYAGVANIEILMGLFKQALSKA